MLGYYMFGAKQMEHVFCLKCGGSVWVALVGVDGIAINVSSLSSTISRLLSEGCVVVEILTGIYRFGC